jgi:hypothetical protein
MPPPLLEQVAGGSIATEVHCVRSCLGMVWALLSAYLHGWTDHRTGCWRTSHVMFISPW